ncbi:MAG: type IV pilus secretin PilQ [Polyangiaceae bacterium]|nr:type IV pilus secretin PilQ [Polyangiaceae bacterium]
MAQPPREEGLAPPEPMMRYSRGYLKFVARVCAAAMALSVATGVYAQDSAKNPAKDPANVIQNVQVNLDGQKTILAVDTSAPPEFRAQMAPGGRRLVVDIINAGVAGDTPVLTDSTGVVAGVLVQPFTSQSEKTARLFIQLNANATYRIRPQGNRLIIELQRASDTGVTGAASASDGRNASGSATATTTVQRVRFDKGDRSDSVILQISGTPKYTQSSPRAGVSRLVFRGATLDSGAERTLDVSAFGGVVRTVSAFRVQNESDQVIVEVERSERAIGAIQVNGNELVWAFALPGDMPSSLTGVGADGGAARKTRVVAREAPIAGVPVVQGGSGDGGLEESESADAEAGAFLPQSTVGQTRNRTYSGRRIDLDLKDADIHNVLRLLADVGRVNIITADNVTGSVTIRMRDVPWDRALDVVLQAKSLGMTQEANVIRVAPLADLEKEREMAIARRRQEFELTPVETRLIPVSYAAASDLQARAKDLLSPRGSIAVDERTNVLIARDIPGNLNQLEELVRSLDTQTPQVLVEARIVEATSRYMRDIGIQWGGDAAFSTATGNPTGLAFPSNVGLVGGASDTQTPTAGLSPFSNRVQNPNFAVNLPATVGTGSGGAVGLTLGHINNTVNLAVRLSAAETSGMVRIISSPRILTLDNHEATISQGTMIPFSQTSAMGVQTTFREAKLQLRVRPHVTADGSISMRVKVNRDEPDFTQTSARGDPTILKREAETDLLVMDGHTAVIGGIFTRNTGRNIDQVPFFGDIPLVGLLFQRRRASDARSELVIFITPRIVNRAESLGR